MKRGRPSRIVGERATERIWAWVTKSERRALEHLAAAERIEIGALVREAVNAYVADLSEQKVFPAHINLRRAYSGPH